MSQKCYKQLLEDFITFSVGLQSFRKNIGSSQNTLRTKRFGLLEKEGVP